jgi:flavin reductase (DIM6/NTAB) family NADH-FMN oxidoreductase RutF
MVPGLKILNNFACEVTMEKAWQDVLDHFHYGIYLVTTVSDEGSNGMIASWVTQCSHEPPLVAVGIRKNRLSHEQLMKSWKFCINVLPRESAGIIKQFKIPDWKKKFDPFKHAPAPSGLPVLDDCIGYLDCSLEHTVDTGDHTLFIGRIRAGAMRKNGKAIALSTSDYDGVYRGSK